jgi:hypothetical protein
MQQIKLRSKTGEDGILHLDVISNFQDTEVNVTVIVEPINNNESASSDWHEFIEQTAGALADDDLFIRYPQGEYEIRESLE